MPLPMTCEQHEAWQRYQAQQRPAKPPSLHYPRLFSAIVMHPKTIAKLARRVKALCSDLDWSNVNSGWIVGSLPPRQLELLFCVDLSQRPFPKHELERHFNGDPKGLFGMRQQIKNHFSRKLATVVWPKLHRKDQTDDTTADSDNPRHPSEA